MTTTIARSAREATEAERPALIALTLEAYQQYEQSLPAGAWPPYAESIRATLSDRSAGRLIIVEQQGAIAGSALLAPPQPAAPTGRAAQPYPEIRLVAVAPHARRQGVATDLVLACADLARAEGFQSIGLHSTQYMADAIRIYLRLGFERSPEYDFTTPAGVLVMGFRLALAGAAARAPLGRRSEA